MKCTYCGGTEFYEGPSGGLSVNILCANPDCRHWFNSTPFGLDDLDKIESTKEEKLQLMKKNRQDELEKLNNTYLEGRDSCKRGMLSRDCLKDEPYSGYACSQADVIRLCGYIDALKGDFK